jgi:hypothetical protein
MPTEPTWLYVAAAMRREHTYLPREDLPKLARAAVNAYFEFKERPTERKHQMANSMTIHINAAAGSHTVFVQQSADNKRTITASIDDAEHDLYECSANSDGTALSGLTDIHVPFWVFRGDKVTLGVDVASNAVSLDISQAGVHYTGVLNPAEAVALVAFVKACSLPDLAA